MRYIFVDLETNDKAKNFSASPKVLSNWPRILQMAWMTADGPGVGNIVREHVDLIKPTDFEITSKALEIHGITKERALSEGIPIMKALTSFKEAVEKANTLVAHNIRFDVNTVMSEFIRQTTHWCQPLFKIKKICTMMSSTKYCKLPGRYGNYKWPKLSELYQKLFNEELAESHEALVDVHTCAKCFFELKRMGVIK